MKHTTIVRLGLVCAGLLASACVTTVKGGGAPAPERHQSDWVLPSSALRDDIEQQAAALPYRHGADRLEAIAWFTSVGEPAYDTLLTFLVDDRASVVASALAALGGTRDHRLVPYLQDAERAEWTGTLALEYARTRVRLGDWDAMPVLIGGLESDVKLERALCVETLFEATRERHGFHAGASLPERQAAVERWRGWWERRSADELLAVAPK